MIRFRSRITSRLIALVSIDTGHPSPNRAKFLSAAASSAYLTVSEIFPIEIRALAIAIFYSAGTAAGGIAAPWFFGRLIDTGSRRALLDGLDLVGWTGVRPLTDQADALRFVVLVDRLYDLEVPVLLGGSGTRGLFSEPMLRGGYRKKYLRCLSRLDDLAARGRGSVAS